ncbi:hypothetical protein ACI7RC_14925 [Brevibacillus sp. B_LB10_24]|uniref:hypothetical protein n=1 Tax=Brevibacillus sp. B_LB10_24 TaxID=3380645 RepID=UPI0038BD4A16
MTLTKVVQVFAVFGILGLFVQIASIIVNISGLESTFSIYLNVLAWILVMFGAIAVYLRQFENLGKLGFFSIVIMLIAFVWTIGYVELVGFSLPVIHELNPSANFENLSDYGPISEAGFTSSILILVGEVLYGLSIYLYSKLTRWPGALIMIAGVLNVFGSLIDILGLISYISLPIAILWMCIKVLKTGRIASKGHN